MPKYKNGLWDGKFRLFKILGGTLPCGLYDKLCSFASERDYEVIDARVPSYLECPSMSVVDAFLNELDIYSGGKSITPYDYQVQAIKTVIKSERSTIISATSSGKSLNLYALTRYYQTRLKGKMLIIVPTVSLVHQMYSDFDDYSSKQLWNVEDYIHKIYAGQDKNSEKKIYLSTWQSLQRQPKSYFLQFDCIFCDEVHVADAKSITAIMEKSTNAFIRAGFTGTLKDIKLHELCITGMFGDIKRVVTNREMMDMGSATELDVKFLVLKYSESTSKEINRKVIKEITPQGEKVYRNNYQNEMDFIAQCTPRNNYISNLVNVLDGNVLVLFTKVENHGKPLFSLLKKKLHKRNVYYISGVTKGDKREQIRNSMEQEKNAVLVASYGTLSTGVNIKSLKYVVFASPYKSEIKVLQSIGRILRLKKGKNRAFLLDIVDDFRYKKSINYSYKHFSRRWDIYKEEQFPVSISEFNLGV
jgi:superfamily II DNA or RNA helicase